MASATATGPDGRQWRIESRPSRTPPWRGLPVRAHEETGSAGALLVRMLFAIVIGLVFSLAVFLIELPFSLLFSRRRAVEARTEGKTLRWRTSAKYEQSVVDEIVAALGRGEESPAPPNAARL